MSLVLPEAADVRKGRIMLVLSRKIGERILIGDNITVTVVRISNGGVRIGIEAPPEFPVIREELKVKMDREGEGNTVMRNPENTRQPDHR